MNAMDKVTALDAALRLLGVERGRWGVVQGTIEGALRGTDRGACGVWFLDGTDADGTAYSVRVSDVRNVTAAKRLAKAALPGVRFTRCERYG